MIDEWAPSMIGWSSERRGFARFSGDRTLRYRLARELEPGALDQGIGVDGDLAPGRRRVVFVMLNPSTANAFRLDPTVAKCVAYAQRWGADVLEVANIFAYRSPHPEDLRFYLDRRDAREKLGSDAIADVEIMSACRDAHRVIAAWGRHGKLADRGAEVAAMLARADVKLEALGTTQEGLPIHPLARGVHRVPIEREPVPWSPA